MHTYYIHICMHACIYTHTHTNTHIIHTHTHTHTHTYRASASQEGRGKNRDANGGTIDVAFKDAGVGLCQCTAGLPNAREERGVEAVLDGVGRAPV